MITVRIERTPPHPIARLESAQHERHFARTRLPRRVLLWLIYPPALLLAALPLVVYITPATWPVMLVLLAVLVPVQFVVALRTLLLATDAIHRERAVGQWDLLLLSGVTARDLVLGKWWAVLGVVYPEWLLTAFLRLGIAVGLAQLLHTCFTHPHVDTSCHLFVDTAFMYLGNLSHIHLMPGLVKVGLAAGLLLVLSLLEAALLTALGVGVALLPLSRFASLGLAGLARLSLIGGLLLGFSFKDEFVGWHWQANRCQVRFIDECSPQIRAIEDTYHRHQVITQHAARLADLVWVTNTLYLGLIPFADLGTHLAADVMRPDTMFALRFFLSRLGYALLTLVLYTLLLTGMLAAARWLAVRQGALPAGDTPTHLTGNRPVQPSHCRNNHTGLY